MNQAPSVAFAADDDHLVGSPVPGLDELDLPRSCVSLKGTTRGLEILISGAPTTADIGARLTELLAEAPTFFAGCDARVAIDGALPGGALACLEDVATRFDLRIVEISPLVTRRRRSGVPRVLRPDDVPQVDLAEGTGPIPDEVVELRDLAVSSDGCAVPAPRAAGPNDVPPSAVPPSAVPPSTVVDLAEALPPGPRLVIGPVRSGVIVEHPGHLVVIGDVNPGAEVRAEGSIIVLGRMRGVAHAAIGCDGGFIVALSLQPQQLRIGRMVARAGDADRPGDGAEIAYATGETIVVERFLGRLPGGLAASM